MLNNAYECDVRIGIARWITITLTSTQYNVFATYWENWVFCSSIQFNGSSICEPDNLTDKKNRAKRFSNAFGSFFFLIYEMPNALFVYALFRLAEMLIMSIITLIQYYK